MGWSTRRDLLAQLDRLWERGDLLRPLLTGETRFPLRLSLKTPSSTDLTDRFEAVRTWTNELTAMPHVRWLSNEDAGALPGVAAQVQQPVGAGKILALDGRAVAVTGPHGQSYAALN